MGQSKSKGNPNSRKGSGDFISDRVSKSSVDSAQEMWQIDSLGKAVLPLRKALPQFYSFAAARGLYEGDDCGKRHALTCSNHGSDSPDSRSDRKVIEALKQSVASDLSSKGELTPREGALLSSGSEGETKKAAVKILCISFTHSFECFAVGTNHGCHFFSTLPLKRLCSIDLKGGVGIIEMLMQENVYAMVGGGETPAFARDELKIWDGNTKAIIRSIKFSSPIKCVRLRKDMFFVGVDSKIFVYTSSDQRMYDSLDTITNWNGTLAISTIDTEPVVACPSPQCGYVTSKSMPQDRAAHKTVKFKANKSGIACLALSAGGALLAAASKYGSMIRVFKASSGELLQELRRGSDNCQIYQLVFHRTNKYLACTSDTKSIHIFLLSQAEKCEQAMNEGSGEELKLDPRTKNQTSKLAGFGGLFSKYFSSEWSMARAKLKDSIKYCAFAGGNSSIVVVTESGKHCVFEIPSKGGHCVLKESRNYLTDGGGS